MAPIETSPPLVALHDSPARKFGQLVLIFLGGLFIYGWKVGVPPIAGTEPLRALVAHQMVQNGNLLIPSIYGELYLRKPPLQYWIIAGTEKLAGVGNEFVWRLPSVVGSAFLAAFLAWWTARWFGDGARLVTGFSCLALIALWSQDRGADIDALDTLASVLTACCILELGFGPTTKRAIWTIALGLCVGAMLLLKGPAGLPTALGALIACVLLRNGRRALKKPWIWVALGIGAAIFASWLLAVYLRVQSQHLPVDSSGAQEAGERMLLRSPGAILRALLVPILVWVYALPVSMGLPLSVATADTLPATDLRRVRVRAIALTVGASLAIGVIAGITNPRYSYVSMPLFATLLGAAVAISLQEDALTWFRGQLAAGLKLLCILWLIAHAVLTVMAVKKIGQIDPREHAALPWALLAVAMGASIVVGAVGLFTFDVGRRALYVAAMVILLGIPFAEMKNAERTHFSGRAAGIELREALGAGTQVSIAALNRDLPQIFYYADVPVRAFGEKRLNDLASAPGDRWVGLSEDEYQAMSAGTGVGLLGTLSKITPLRMANDTVYLAWYEPRNIPTSGPVRP